MLGKGHCFLIIISDITWYFEITVFEISTADCNSNLISNHRSAKTAESKIYLCKISKYVSLKLYHIEN